METLELILQIVIYVLLFFVGASIASFLNVVSYRVPNKISIVKPNSFCPKCQHELKFFDKIPIFSYLFLGGKCHYCKEKISIRYFLVELLLGLIYVLTYLKFGLTFYTLILILMASVMLVLSLIDFDSFIIPDATIIILACLAIPLFFIKNDANPDYLTKLFGLLVIVIITLILFVAGRIRKKELIGFGDIKYLAVMALVLGWQKLLLGIFLAAIVAFIVEVLIKRKKSEVPFGPYLSIGFMVSLLVGTDLINLYLKLFEGIA